MSKRSFSPISGCIAYGEDGSMRMRPSQSTAMNRNVGSTIAIDDVEVRR